MRKSLPLSGNKPYPIPYVNPPTELRVAVDETKKKVVIRCDRLGEIIFPTIAFGHPVDIDVMNILISRRRGDLVANLPPEAFAYLRQQQLAKALGITASALRKRIKRFRKRLSDTISKHWPSAVYRYDMLVERSPAGYRLASSARIVAPTLLPLVEEPVNSTN